MATKTEPEPVRAMGEITHWLEEMREGDPEATEELLSHVYGELRALAASKMAHEAPGQTLQPTALVHEAWEVVDLPAPLPDDDLLAIDEALNRFAEREPRAAELVKLCFFVGLTHEQAAKELGISVATVERQLAFSRAWLFREIQKSRGASG